MSKNNVEKATKSNETECQKTFLVIGGYGNAGRYISTYLLGDDRVNVVIAGRNLAHAADLATRLCTKFGEDRAVARYCDATDKSSLMVAMDGVDMVVVAACVTSYVDTILEAVTEKGVDYCDILMSSPDKYKALEKYQNIIEEKNLTVITDCGVHPGMAAPLVKLMSAMFATPIRADVAACFRMNWRSLPRKPESISEFASELNNFDPTFYHNGKWLTAKATAKPPLYDFGNLFGQQRCMPMMLGEMRGLPHMFPTLHHTGFYVAGFNGFTDAVIMPICYCLIKLFPKAKKLHEKLGNMFYWSLRTFPHLPFGTIVQVVGTGKNSAGNEKKACLRIYHDDAYALTGAATVACLYEYLDGHFERYKGHISLQGEIVEPDTFVKTLQAMGSHASVV